MEIFAPRLKAARQAKGLTRSELGTCVGMDQGHISRLEHGCKGLSTEHLQALTRALGVTTSYLLREDNQGEGAPYSAHTTCFDQLLRDYKTPAGLDHTAKEVSKDGYIQLLITIRAVTDNGQYVAG